MLSTSYSTVIIPNRDGLGLGTVALALIVFGLGLDQLALALALSVLALLTSLQTNDSIMTIVQ